MIIKKMWFEIFLCRVRAVPGGYREDFLDWEGGFPYREAPGQTRRVDTYGIGKIALKSLKDEKVLILCVAAG